jgi:hypothetical protein
LGWQSPDGKATQNEWPGAEGDILVVIVAPPSYKFDLFRLPDRAMGSTVSFRQACMN